MGEQLRTGNPADTIRDHESRLAIIERTARFNVQPTKVLGYATVNTEQVCAGGVLTDLTGLTVTVEIDNPGRIIRVRGAVVVSKQGSKAVVSLNTYDSVDGRLSTRSAYSIDGTTSDYGFLVAENLHFPTQGTHTYKLVLGIGGVDTATATANGASGGVQVSQIVVEDIGSV